MKKIKKIIYLIILFTGLLYSNFIVFAENNIELIISNNEITLEDTFDLSIVVTTDSNLRNGEILVNGLEDFYKVSQNNYSSYMSVNGKVENTQTIKLSFYPNKAGEFEIGPAMIGEGTGAIISNTIIINVEDILGASNKNSNEKENIIEEDEIIQEKEELKDIKDFKWSFGIFNYIYTIIFIIFVLIIYHYLKYLKNTKIVKKEEVIIEPQYTLDDYIKKLKDLIIVTENLGKSDFYEQLNYICREYFEFIGIYDAKNMTYNELQREKIDQELLYLYKKSYYNEFNLEKDDIEFRKELIDKIVGVL